MSSIKDKFISHVPARLLDERQRLGLTQADVARVCGISREMWGRYEKGESVPGSDVLFAFATAGADMMYLMSGTRQAALEEPAAAYELRPDQAALLDNYEHCSKEDQSAINHLALRLSEAEEFSQKEYQQVNE